MLQQKWLKCEEETENCYVRNETDTDKLCLWGYKTQVKKKVKINKLLYILFPILSTLQKCLKPFMLSLELSIVIILYRRVSTDCIMFTTGLSWMTY